MYKRSGSMYSTQPSSQLSTSASKRSRMTKRKREVYVGKSPIPKQLRNVMRYCERVSVTVGGTGVGNFHFSCNGLYDPNTSGLGRQPSYFDEIMSLYNHYHVLKAKMTVYFPPMGGSYMGMIVVDDDTALNSSDGAVWAERPSAKKTMVTTSGAGGQKLVCYWNARSVFGGDTVANTDLKGTATANPAEQQYFHVCIDGGGSVSSTTVGVWVEIEYDTLFDEWKSVAGS